MGKIGAFLASIMPHGDLPKRTGRPNGKVARTTTPYSRGDKHWKPVRGKYYVYTKRGKAVRQSEGTSHVEATDNFAAHMAATYGPPVGSWEEMGFTVKVEKRP